MRFRHTSRVQAVARDCDRMQIFTVLTILRQVMEEERCHASNLGTFVISKPRDRPIQFRSTLLFRPGFHCQANDLPVPHVEIIEGFLIKHRNAKAAAWKRFEQSLANQSLHNIPHRRQADTEFGSQRMRDKRDPGLEPAG